MAPVWHPQEITAGSIPYGGRVASSAEDGAALIDSSSAGGEQLDRELFTTSTGGDVAGSSASLTLSTAKRTLTKRKLKAAHDEVRISGVLAGALGGEMIVVSERNLSGGSWHEQTVVAGANGGSFSTTWHITQSSIFLAQWAGDSGRPGEASKTLAVTVH